ncbi:MAG TPA: Fe-S cluster assembly protein SufD [Gammaproteobacteria bacterium]|nr:Fe-S cluster assembly protein SufD [Gammaproteobacteria bacterium]
MSEVSAAVRHYVDQFARVAGSLPGDDLPWLKARRESAIRRFSELGFPTPRNEAWKYTRVAPIEKRAFVPPTGISEVSPADVERFYLSETDCHHLVFLDGRYSASLSSPGELPEGVLIEDLSGALERAPELLEEILADGDADDRHAFSVLNSAFMHDGAVIRLPRDGVVTYPIHLIFVATGRQDDFVTNPRVVIQADRGSRAAIVESFVSLDDSVYFNNVRTDVTIGASACIEHYKLQRESAKAYHVSDLRVHQSAGSGFHSHSFSFGGALVRNDIRVGLDAEDAACTLNGLFMASGRQHVDYHTYIDHHRPRCMSRELYKGILGGRARGVFNGAVYVHPGAVKTDAHQTNNNLLLSRDAEIDTKPQLEIYADDVKCSHGATVGQLDENMLFYLRSRGIGEQAARGLLVYGFARDLVDRIEIKAIRNRLADSLLQWLPHADKVRGLVQ